MPEFRKWILVLAILGLFAGLASAQVGANSFTCTSVSAAVPPTLRAEGFTELGGDIVLNCTGGSPPALGTAIPTANFTIFLNTNVTSRLLPNTNASNASEALLLIDEPGSGLPGYGPSVPQTPCLVGGVPASGVGAGAGGCSQIVGTVGATGGVPVPANCAGCTAGNGYLSATPGANVFQGVVAGSQVTFFGIPLLPPSTAGDSRIFRITNIRANANGIVGGGVSPGSVTASISISGSTSLPITNPNATIGFVEPGLNQSTTGLRNATNTGGGGVNFAQCNSVSVTSTGSTATASGGGLQFQENFATAFKTGITATIATQNVPGAIYSSESGFILDNAALASTISGTGVRYFPGQADYGTRLKAVFSNVPSGVSIYVSTRDITNSYASYAGTGNALLVVSETATDGASFIPPAINQTQTYTGPGPAGATAPGIAPITLIPGSSGAASGEAVWEIIGQNPAAIDTDFFGVYVNFSASPANNTPAAPSSFSVTLSFAPTPNGTPGASASVWSAASSTLTVPRFSDSLDITKTYASFTLCTTDLLYPYVINISGFDTGLAIANTTTDPFGTTAQQGTCSLNFYGSSAPSAAFTTPVIATGTVYANLASTLAPGFSGYMIAVCNFQFAHGFAFVSDVGARNLAMGYLPLIVTTPRNATEALNN